MKALVLGCGSIGLRHIGHLRQLGVDSIEAADPDPVACQRARDRYQIPVYQNPEQALSLRPEIVLVCTPASSHISMAIQGLEAGAHLFVEKPLSTSLEGIEALVQKARSEGRIVQVGYNLRYHPAMRATKEILDSGRLGRILSAHAEFGLYLKKWWPLRDYRDSYITDDEISGGLLLDASHEIDLLVWFLGGVKEVKAFGERVSRLEIQGLDLIKVLMRMESGALASLHLDCLQPTYTRRYALVGEDSALTWDCTEDRADKSLGCLKIWDSTTERYEQVPVHGSSQDIFLEELRDFLASVSTGTPPKVSLEEGIEVLRVACSIQRAIESHFLKIQV